ncbi:LuxR C-terminal-related transcriptional regulator [Paraconexibacter antarcticus]|uniref:LuxR C-terminal-related transcriptional regulator n=1 Tax=Paraconexibacter antarcticus TaxID=2949664 RepID=A0ABY5DRR0_9ACTN|nr:LuxR family transcriptional regulator [Paraconexibacter antarcticus]UTI63599.1 LuxR C-terminal-related transcriptional regulator [Paraconexibacter antarcticus]
MSLRPRVRSDRPRRLTVEERLAALPVRAGELLGDAWTAAAPCDVTTTSAGAVEARRVLDAVLAHLDAASPSPEPAALDALAALAADALEVEDAIRRQVDARRRALSVAVDEALSRLRRFQTSAELVDAACREAARACGFDRVLLSRIVGDTWYPWMVEFGDDEQHRRVLLEGPAAKGIPLSRLPQEREVLASRRPMTILRAEGWPLPLAMESGSDSYVVVPLTPAGRVVGFMHADHGLGGPRVDDEDRDILWMFAEAFGRIYERVVLLERMARQRAHVRESFEVVETFMTGLANSEIELVRHDEPTAGGSSEPDRRSEAAEAIDILLTDREREVMDMMLQGFTNQRIAERLVIKEGTVKSHVKHILRKVGAANRTEAISKYAGATR